MSIERLLTDEQKGDAARLVMVIRAAFGRYVNIVEEAVAKDEASDEERKRAALMAQMLTAIDVGMMFPTMRPDGAEEWARDFIAKVFNGPAPSFRMMPPTHEAQKPSDDSRDDWPEEMPD